jgi:hypothetical protein
MRENKKRDAYFWAQKHWHERRPQNVGNQIKRFWDTKDGQKRKIIYEYIQLEWIISEYGKIRF